MYHACILIRGSINARTISDIRTPIWTITVVIRIKDPAMYISCESSALSNSGPMVGRLITVATIRLPEMLVQVQVLRCLQRD